ncbi:type IV secretory system conjugative DNA transfer family protein [Nocardiopsis sp. NPDC050513]|uniref:type IV secretory system conjugative DNA transfer family protein n=1 Tax=Nocardiopsis sp. NPDC050513 TaxID=3364338 RepID=UPI0037882115
MIAANLALWTAVAGVGAVTWISSVFVLRWARHAYLSRGAHVLEIHAPPHTTVDHATAFWTHTLGLLRPRWTHRLLAPHLAWEYTATPAGIRVQIWVPGTVNSRTVQRAITSAWPGATTRLAPATPAIPADQCTRGHWLRTARADHYPLRTTFADDSLRGLFGELANLASGQQALVRVCARPASPHRASRARAAARLRGQHSPFRPWQSPPRRGQHINTLPGISDDVRAILTKASSPRLACQISVAVTTEHPSRQAEHRARTRARSISASLAAYTSGLNALRRAPMLFPNLWIRCRYLARGYLLSTAELAAIAHLPTDPAVPGLTRASARRVAPSPDVPRSGRVLGHADAGPRRPIATTVADARQHIHILGKTGSGKSTLLTHMIRQDAEAGRSALVIEPRGDLVLDVLDRLPARAIGSTVLFDPADPTPPPRINLLQIGTPAHAADTVTGIFRTIYADSWGPRTDDILRASTLTLAATRDANLTLGDIPRLLADDPWRTGLFAQLHPTGALRDFWRWYSAQSPQMRAAATDPLLNKLRTVLLRPWAAAVLASGASTIDLPHLLDHGGLVLMRLPKGHLGEDTAGLLGTITLAATWHAITARAAVPEHRRPDTCVYLDEAANFLRLPGSLADMLAEARGYRAAMVLAHQELHQLPPATRAAVDAHTRTKVFFNLAPDDASKLERHTLPYLNAYDLSHLGSYQAAVRTIHDAAELPAVTLRTQPPTEAIPYRAEHIRRGARRFATTRNPDPRDDQEDRR